VASIFCPDTYDIEYSLVDRRIRFFEYENQVFYDEETDDNYPNWEKKLIQVIENYGLNRNRGKGHYAFILRLADEGKIELLKGSIR
jgi:hypothetical protein